MANKLGVYLCGGCGIGECVSREKLAQIATGEHHVGVVRTSAAFCLEDVQMIKDDIAREGLDAVVIAACSPRVNTDVFAFPTVVAVERVNLREQVAWSHPPGTEETQSLADDTLRMGIVSAQKTRPPTPYTEAHERAVLVIGGGVAGMTAALGAARAGVRTILVERTPRLGGFAAQLWKQVPKHSPYRELEEPGVDSLISEVASEPGIETLTGAEVLGISGQPGKFEVSIKRDGGPRSATVGAVVLATGWRPFEAPLRERYGLGRSPNVITNVTLEELGRTGKLVRPSDGKAVKAVAIIHCDGAGDEANIQHSASVTYLVSLKHATYIRERCPDATVYVIYRDMQTPGQYEYFYKKVQEDPGVLFTRANVKDVSTDPAGGLVVELEDSPLGGGIQLPVDVVVLATGMVPATSESGGLNLEYLQGKELPVSQYGFADSNFICFPNETRRTGIYSAGCVRKPMDLAAAALDGSAAALKAIQSIEKSSAGAAVHPRVGDLSFPSIFLQNCTMCGRCSQECPFGAIELSPEKNLPFVVTNRCRRCGICMGACPVQVISFDDYSVDMVASMIKAVEIPEGDEEKPRILVLACENDAYPALDMAGIGRLQLPASLRVIPVRCLGSVNAIMAADAFSRGFDGVLLLGCKSGDDYQCHFIKGSELLATRMANVRETLGRMMLEPERAQVMEVEISGSSRLPERLDEFVRSIKALGPNPMKGF